MGPAVAPAYATTTEVRDDGALVQLWSATCGICGFVTGIARVTLPDRRSVLLSGAGCYTRRGPKEARAWAQSVMR
jgi:hypothetical protein